MIALQELSHNNWFVMGSIIIGLYIVYKIINRKDRALEQLEAEYSELITAEKYKVKGQF